MRHVGCRIGNDLAFHAVVSIRIIRNIILDFKSALPHNPWSKLKTLGGYRGAWTPRCPVINPSSALGVKRVVSTFLHNLPTPMLSRIYKNAVGVVTEFPTIVPLTKAMTACPGDKSKHFFIWCYGMLMTLNIVIP